MIETVRLRNFKNHRDTEIDLGRLTALVGPNGAGKTSVLEAIQRLGTVARKGRLEAAIDDISEAREELVRRGTDTLSISVKGGIGEKRWLLRITIPPDSSTPEELRERDTELVECKWGRDHSAVDTINDYVYPSPDTAKRVKEGVGEIRLHRLVPDRMRNASKMKIPFGKLNTDGSNLAAVLSYCMMNEHDRNQRINDSIHSLLPSITDVRTELQPPPEGPDRHALLLDTVGGKGIKAKYISEGALVALGIIAAVTDTEDKGSHVIMLDGLERSLHPKAQRDLVALLRDILDTRHDLQILFTTHSPYIVDELSPEEVYLLNTDDEGIAHARRLSEHPDSERALEVLTTGEFWSAEGEDWVIDQASGDGQPAPSDEATTSDA